jgi:hypothetical protein
MLRGLTQNQKILLGAGAAALAYYGFRKTRVAATAPREQVYSSGRINPTVPDKLGNAADIAKVSNNLRLPGPPRSCCFHPAHTAPTTFSRFAHLVCRPTPPRPLTT